MDIIFLNQDSGQLFGDIVNAFARAGNRCALLSTAKHNVKLDPSVKFVESVTYDRSSTAKRFMTWLKYTLHAYRYVKQHPSEELFMVSNPPLTYFIPLILNRKYSLLVYDIYPDAIVSVGMLKESNILIRWWKKKNEKIYRGAKKIYTLSNNMAKALEQYTSRERIGVIPNWADTSLLKPIAHKENPWLVEKGLQDKFIVLYSGNIGDTHNVEKLVDVAKIIIDRKDILFIIIGDGSKKNVVKSRIEEFGVDNVLLLPFQDKDIIPFSIGAADIGVITLDEKSSAVSVPSKTYSMLAVGSCLMCIAAKTSELSALVDEYNCGMVFSSSDVQGMANFIIQMASDKEMLHLRKENSRKASLDFTPENANKYVELYE
jgi:glycosyltransferase involved in cell wall biosynthesis